MAQRESEGEEDGSQVLIRRKDDPDPPVPIVYENNMRRRTQRDYRRLLNDEMVINNACERLKVGIFPLNYRLIALTPRSSPSRRGSSKANVWSKAYLM
jgi:hypothetical protein